LQTHGHRKSKAQVDLMWEGQNGQFAGFLVKNQMTLVRIERPHHNWWAESFPTS